MVWLSLMQWESYLKNHKKIINVSNKRERVREWFQVSKHYTPSYVNGETNMKNNTTTNMSYP